MYIPTIDELFDAIDSMDSVKFSSFLNEEADFIFGNSPVVSGRINIENAVGGFFQSIQAIKHHDLQIFQNNNFVIVRGNSTYTRKNNTKLTVGFCNVLEFDGNLIKNYHIYIDLSELYK